MEEKGLHAIILNAKKSAIIPRERLLGVVALILLGTSLVLFGCSQPGSAYTAPADSSSITAQVATD